MSIKLGWVMGRALALVLLLCGSYLSFVAYNSSEALGDFTIFFVISGIVLACVGALGLFSKFR